LEEWTKFTKFAVATVIATEPVANNGLPGISGRAWHLQSVAMLFYMALTSSSLYQHPLLNLYSRDIAAERFKNISVPDAA
jgi:hypothetical protein